MIYVGKMKYNPSKLLERKFEELSDVARFSYNYLMKESIDIYKKYKLKPSLKQIQFLQKEFRLLVKNGIMKDRNNILYPLEFQSILKNIPSQILENEAKKVYQAWSRIGKDKIPSFANKYERKQSFTIHKKVDSTFKLENNILTVSGITLKIKNLRFLTEAKQIKLITIRKSHYGWYLNLVIEILDNTFNKVKTNKEVGIDWGVSKFATDSNGNYFNFKESDMYKGYLRLSKRLKELQRILSIKRNSNKEWRKSLSYLKLKNKIGGIYEKLANIRKNFIFHIANHYLVNYDKIHIEDLKPSNMLKNHKLARSISEGMFYTWKVILKYKAEWYNKEIILKNPRNTSQNCSCCGSKKTIKLKLSEKIFNCDSCGFSLGRDYNAAINILKA